MITINRFLNSIVRIRLIVFACLLTANVFGQLSKTEAGWKAYFLERINSLDPIEGIWSTSVIVRTYDHYNILRGIHKEDYSGKVSIYQYGGKFYVHSFTADPYTRKYARITFESTANAGVYLRETYYSESGKSVKVQAGFTSTGILTCNYYKPTRQLEIDRGNRDVRGMKINLEHNWVKLAPISKSYGIPRNQKPKEGDWVFSGTGFALTSTGYVITNNHVIKDAKIIKIRGVLGDFSKVYRAKLIVKDQRNDLAILKVTDRSFLTLGQVPYSIKEKGTMVGENIFVLGYPLRASMGDEVKLTNGIISSKSGFQGDITSFQISAPVQPGNSGGPLLDEKGCLIGIINSKHSDAQNAAYAIKVRYLMNLIEMLDKPPKIQETNKLSGKTLSTQVKLLSNFVYIIEVN